jgi:aspartate-semialdehyde dehydrogenase
MRIAVVGVTGLVGGVMLEVLSERNLDITELIPVASARSVGKEIEFKGKKYKVISMEDAINAQPDIAIFSAGGSTSLKWAPKFAEVGTFVIDNSSAWRMDSTKPLLIPEVNADILTEDDKIIANPNCSTIQMVLALKGIHKEYGIKRLVISTYQSVSGTGVAAVRQMNDEREGKDTEMVYPHPIDQNCLPHGGTFNEDGYTTEEIKLVNETRKILGDDQIQITATVVRVPVIGGHSESVNVETKKAFEINDIITVLKNTDGVIVQNDHQNNEYPMPLYAHHKDEVFVGRIRRDYSIENGLNLWIVADNLRKGAATNAVQIAEYLIKNDLVKAKLPV